MVKLLLKMLFMYVRQIIKKEPIWSLSLLISQYNKYKLFSLIFHPRVLAPELVSFLIPLTYSYQIHKGINIKSIITAILFPVYLLCCLQYSFCIYFEITQLY
jgi:hypothetical protein